MLEGTRVCWPEPGRIILEPFTLPEPEPGQVIVQTEVTLISPGTERAFFLGLPNAQHGYPYYPGYSNIGRVIALGEGVEPGLNLGDRVASGGNHASHVRLSAAYCWKVPEEIPSADAVYFNLISIALQGVRKARIELGESVLVLGLGLIGNLALQLARLQGAFPVLGIDLDAGRRQTAMDCGADACFDPAVEGLAMALSDAADGHRPAVVIEATGSPEVVNHAFTYAADGGRVVLLASTRGVTETNFYRDIHSRGLIVLGAHARTVPRNDSSPGFWTHAEETRTALRLIAGKRLRVGPLTTELLSWQDAPGAYEQLATWRKDVLGMVLRWQDVA